MVFNSLTFLIFFGIVLTLHYLPLSWTVKKLNLLTASYLFYAAWNPPFVLLLMLSAVADFVLANWMGGLVSAAARRALLCISLVLNLGLLGVFKYGNFLLDNFVALLHGLGIDRRIEDDVANPQDGKGRPGENREEQAHHQQATTSLVHD